MDGSINTVIPIAWGMTRISQKMMEASRAGYRSIGWSVRAEAMLGVWQHSKNEWSLRTARNSGRQQVAVMAAITSTKVAAGQ